MPFLASTNNENTTYIILIEMGYLKLEEKGTLIKYFKSRRCLFIRPNVSQIVRHPDLE
jgi:hypothetical protein